MRRRIRDWAIAAGVVAIMLVTGLADGHSGAGSALPGYALLAAGGLALAARRRAPRVVLAVTGLCAVGYQAAGFDVLAVPYLVAVYGAVRAGYRAVAVAASVAVVVAVDLTALALHGGDVGVAIAQGRGVLELAWLIAAFATGEAVRLAERRADEAERTREETARRRADEERLHIARELHDSLTHQISVIKVQAEVAVHLAQKRGEQPPEALLAIRDAGREAALELRATLEALRGDNGDRDNGPYHGLDQVPDLVRRARTAGLDATLTVEGQRDDVPAAVDGTAYRIVQESLTNVRRHAEAASASVRIDYRPDALVIRVDDDGTARPGSPPVPGAGLLGMRERVAALGGRLRTAPRGEGGFTVHAELPVERTP